MNENKICPKCGGSAPQYVHAKTRKGEIRYRCRECRKTYVLTEPRYSDEFKKNAVNLYLEGKSSRAVGKILGIGPNTAGNWVKEYYKSLP